MKQKILRIWNLLTKPAVELKGLQRKQSSLLAGMLVAFILISFLIECILLVKSVFFSNSFSAHTFLPFISLLFLLPAYLSSRTKNLQRTVWLSIITLKVLIFFAAWIMPVKNIFYILLLLVIPIMLTMIYLSLKIALPALLFSNAIFIYLPWIKNAQLFPKDMFLTIVIFNTITIFFFLIDLHRNILEQTRFYQIKKEQERYRKLVEASSDSIIQVDPNMKVLFANAAYYLSVGFTPEDKFDPGLKNIMETDLHAFRAIQDTLITRGTAELEYSIQHHNGQTLYRQANFSIVYDEDKNPDSFTAIIRDVTERKKLENKLEFIAMHDQLTGLPNRTLLMDRLYHAIEQTKRTGLQIAVLFLDLDNFKTINDTLGHPEGDLFLQVIANRLERNLRSCDTVGRWSGDEFIIILENITQVNQALRVAKKISNFLSQPYERGGQLFQVTASIGICMVSVTDDAGKLIEYADQALYQSKRSGKNQISVFQP